MTERAQRQFRDCAQRWSFLAARILAWRPGDFWSATPLELNLCLRDPAEGEPIAAPSRDLIAKLMERDING